MKSNRIVQVFLLVSALVLSAAGAPFAPSVLAAGSPPSATAPNASADGSALLANKQVSQAHANVLDTLAYTVTLTNTSVISPLTTLMTDTLPVSLAFQPGSLWASDGVVTSTAGSILWSGVITTSGVISIGFQARVVTGNTTITNDAVADAGVNGLVTSPVVQTVVAQPSLLLFLPIVMRSPPPQLGIFGHVTQNGSPAASIALLLRFYNGAAWSTAASLSTALDGSYLFNPPALLPGQKYYVSFINNSINSQLFRWATRELTAFQPSDSVPLGNFDIANIVMTSPAPGATIGLPFTFQWTRRPATPSDTYEFDLYGPNLVPYFFTAPPLGYVGSFTLNGLPPGFSTGAQYAWEMWVYSPDGGFGISFYNRDVTFSNAGAALPSAPGPGQQRTSDLPALLARQK